MLESEAFFPGRLGIPIGQRPFRTIRRYLTTIVLFSVFVPAVEAPAYDRWVTLEGARNFRDIGRYDAGTTQMVATHLVYRSDALHQITASDAAVIESLGVRSILDIRWYDEIASLPDSALLDPFSTHTIAHVYLVPAPTWEERYSETLFFNLASWRRAFEMLADPANLPLDYHCQAGKDRAGILTALLLTLLGVDRETVIEDYLLSEDAWGAGTVGRSWIETVLDDVESSGGIDTFLDLIGVDESERQAVRENLLVPKPLDIRAWKQY